MSYLEEFFATEGFMPHGMCLLWKPSVFWMHVVADAITALSYYSIPFVLIYFVMRRRDIAFPWIFWMFGLFILACGTTHIMGIWTMWNPDYAVSGLIKVLTAAVSIATAIILWPLVPKAIALPSSEQLALVNSALSRQVQERHAAETALQRLNEQLESRVRDRTSLLEEANRRLEGEITERRQAEEKLKAREAQLLQAQKMEAVGGLTGGLAHDFNNLLSVVIGNLDLLDPKLAGDPDAQALAQRALSASMRGSELTRKLLAFARKQQLQSTVIDLNELVSGTTALLRRTLGENIEISLHADENLWPVETDSAQMESALTNIAINARDAMPGGGRLKIETANVHLDAANPARDADMAPGDYVVLSVIDTGSGISRENLNRVFEPFFTTKDVGKGSGLGLSIVHGFVNQSGGHVKIISELGQGTTVRLYLPRSTAELTQPVKADPYAGSDGGGAIILVVEDNDEVRQMVMLQLKEMGYRTLDAASGRDAMKIIDSDAKIDLLFSDIVMPGGMNGKELAEEAVKKRPGLPVLLTSGFTETTGLQGWATGQFRHLLAKPYRKHQLAEKVAEVLAEAQTVIRA